MLQRGNQKKTLPCNGFAVFQQLTAGFFYVNIGRLLAEYQISRTEIKLIGPFFDFLLPVPEGL